MARKQNNNPLDLKPEQEVAKELAKALVPICQQHGITLHGNVLLTLDDDKEFPVVYGVFPNGDFIVWFLFKGYYSMMALVNQKMKHVATFPAHELQRFEAELAIIKLSIGK